MKIWSPLSSVLTMLVVLGIVFGLVSAKNNQPKTGYHQSEWNVYAPEIDLAVESERFIKPINLKHVYGVIVSHHVPATIPKLVEFYLRLKQNQSVKNFIVIGPDHVDAGRSPVTASDSSFFTTYGEVKPVAGLAAKLEGTKLVNIEESLFDPEHSVGSQILIISRIFPGAKVTPIILRSDTTMDQARALGKTLAAMLDDETVLVGSIDFSHYLPTDQAVPIDRLSGAVISQLDLESLDLIRADSPGSVAVFVEVMKDKNAINAGDLDILNTNDLMNNSDYTTGYIFGYWGK